MTNEPSDDMQEEQQMQESAETKNNEYGVSYVKEEKKIAIDERALEIKNISDDKRVIGTERVFKLLRSKELDKLFLTQNVPKDIKQEIEHLASLCGTDVTQLNNTNAELGIICRKPFPISVLGVKK